MGCPVDPIHHLIVRNYCEETFSSCLFGFAKLCKALMASAYHRVCVSLCKVTSFQSLSQPCKRSHTKILVYQINQYGKHFW